MAVHIGNGQLRGRAKIVIVTDDGKLVDSTGEEIPPGTSFAGQVIVANYASPKLVLPLRHQAVGVITETGSALCHLAKNMCEMGWIGILGLEDATKIYQDGDMIDVQI